MHSRQTTGSPEFHSIYAQSSNSWPSPFAKRYSGLITPLLDMDMDTSPFSDSFSDIIESKPHSSSNIVPISRRNVVCLADSDSFDIERIVNVKDDDVPWEDDEIEEIIIISPKLKSPSYRIVEQPNSIVAEQTIRENLPAGVDAELSQRPAVVKFNPLYVLKNGSAAQVYLAKSEANSQLYAIKSVSKSDVFPGSYVERALSEQVCLKIATEAEAAFLPRLHMSFQDADRFYMAMDYHPGGNLLAHITRNGPFAHDKALFYASEVAEALAFLHSVGIVHRDLKPENVVIAADGHVVLNDFGFAKLLFSSDALDLRPNSRCGSRECQAPEMLLGWTYDFAVDCWGFGVLLYMMYCGLHPFMDYTKNEDPAHMQYRIVHGLTIIGPSQSIAPEVQDIVIKCLEKNPQLRLNIDGIKAHEYFDGVDWVLIKAKQYDAPYIPALSNDEIDLQYCEKEFLDLDAKPFSVQLDGRKSASPDADVFDGFSFTLEHPTACVDPNIQEALMSESEPRDLSTVNTSVKGKRASAHPIGSNRSSSASRNVRSILKEPSIHFPADLHYKPSTPALDVKAELDLITSCKDAVETPRRAHKLRKRKPHTSTDHPSFLSRAVSSFPLFAEPSPRINRPSKLRKKNRSSHTSDISCFPDLPTDIVQKGRGIAYTHTPPGFRSHISLSPFVLGSCFEGLAVGLGLRKCEGLDENVGMRSTVMRQMYGSSWSIGLDQDARASVSTLGIPDGLGLHVDDGRGLDETQLATKEHSMSTSPLDNGEASRDPELCLPLACDSAVPA